MADSARGLLPAALIAGIAVLTLTPGSPTRDPPELAFVLDPADAIRNALLFAPLGAALAARGWRVAASVAVALVLSGAIELAQLAIENRVSSPWDVGANALGALLGAWAWARYSARREARSGVRDVVCSAVVLGATLALPLWLQAPRAPRGALFSHQPPRLAHLAQIEGGIAWVHLGEAVIPRVPLRGEEARRVAQALGEDLALEVRLANGARVPAGRVGLFMWTTTDQETALALLTQDGALIGAWSTRGSLWGLEPAWARLENAGLQAGGPGADGEVAVFRGGGELCSTAGAARPCARWRGLGTGWRLLAPAELSRVPHVQMALAVGDSLWLLALSWPLGASLRRGGVARWAAGAVVVSWALAALWLPVAPTQLEALGAAAGLALGSRRERRQMCRSSQESGAAAR